LQVAFPEYFREQEFKIAAAANDHPGGGIGLAKSFGYHASGIAEKITKA
jgi:hypothetical protein